LTLGVSVVLLWCGEGRGGEARLYLYGWRRRAIFGRGLPMRTPFVALGVGLILGLVVAPSA